MNTCAACLGGKILLMLFQALHKILSPLPPDDVKSAELQSTLHPSPLRKLINANFDMDTLLPRLAADTLLHLQNVIQDTITTAENFSGIESLPDVNKTEVGLAFWFSSVVFCRSSR